MPEDPASLDALRGLLHRRRCVARVFVLVTAFCLLLGIPLVLLDRRGLVLLAALFSAYALFLVVDCGLLAQWRGRLLGAWQSGAVNLAVFAGGIATLPTLPKATLAALLGSLPVLTPAEDRDLGLPERAALAAFSDWRWLERTAGTLLPAVLAALGAAAGAAFGLGWLRPDAGGLACLAVAALAPIGLRILVPRQSRRRLRRPLAGLSAAERSRLAGLARSLDWTGVAPGRQAGFLRELERA